MVKKKSKKKKRKKKKKKTTQILHDSLYLSLVESQGHLYLDEMMVLFLVLRIYLKLAVFFSKKKEGKTTVSLMLTKAPWWQVFPSLSLSLFGVEESAQPSAFSHSCRTLFLRHFFKFFSNFCFFFFFLFSSFSVRLFLALLALLALFALPSAPPTTHKFRLLQRTQKKKKKDENCRIHTPPIIVSFKRTWTFFSSFSMYYLF